MINKKGFKFAPFSEKQLQLLSWWVKGSPVANKFMIVTDGSIRSSKTIIGILSYVLWSMSTFKFMDLAICGKTVMSVRRNVINPLKQMLVGTEYILTEHRSENYIEIQKGSNINNYYLFGGKDESSQDLVQGLTLAGCFMDEVALMPLSFFQQAMARLSIEGSKLWTTSNPASPYHWFYKDYIKRLDKINGFYMHFTMDDNPSLSEAKKNQYKILYSGVWAERYIEGRWVVANGLVYDMFNKDRDIVEDDDIPYSEAIKWFICCDYGTGNATVFLLCFVDIDGKIWVCREYYFAGRIEAQAQNDYSLQKSDEEFADDLHKFILDNEDLHELSYRKIPIVIDPTALSFRTTLCKRRKMRVKKGINDVINGIRTVASLMSLNKLKVCDQCTHLLQEFGLYQWDQKKEMLGVDAVLKQNDHCCLVGDTLIDTTEGLIPIKNLVGKTGYVNTINPKTKEKCIKKFDSVCMTQENAKIIRINLENNDYIDLTPDHPILTVRGWVKAGEIKKDDEIITTE